MTVCVLLRRDNRWLLGVRGPDVGYAPRSIGMIGGHLEDASPGLSVLEDAGRREMLEETGVDLSGVPLRYLESALLPGSDGTDQVTVTFIAPAPPHARPVPAAPAELTAVGWWTLADLERDPRTPAWLPGLIRRAEAVD